MSTMLRFRAAHAGRGEHADADEDEGRGAGYPSLTRIDDQHVGIVYEGSQADLVFEPLTIAELLQPSGAVGLQ